MKFNAPQSLRTIAGIINCKYSGDDAFILDGLNEIHMVTRGDITFVDHPKYYDRAINSGASAVIINKQVKCPQDKVLIFSDDPFSDYVSLVRHFFPFRPCNKNISDSAVIGDGTTIQPGVFIGNHVSIGKNCIIHSNVSINDHSFIGDHVIISSNTVIGADAYYYQRKTEGYKRLESCGRVVIEDNVEIGANCTIDRGVSSDTVIGKGTKLDNLVMVGHDTKIGRNCLIVSQVGIAGVVIIEDDVILWGQVGIQKDLTIGKGAVVLGQSGVVKSLKGNTVYFGSPVREAREKMKELALIKHLPDIIEVLKPGLFKKISESLPEE